MEDPELDRTARRFAEALAELGSGTSPKRLAERVKQLEMGLPAEDHFMLLLSWLDRCHMVHRLDQLQLPPGSASAFRVPDLLAVFFYEGGETPVLIEVKKTKKDKLAWTEKYLYPLKHYANVLDLPLLVAVQWHDGGLWTLNDVAVFKKANVSYHLDFKTVSSWSDRARVPPRSTNAPAESRRSFWTISPIGLVECEGGFPNGGRVGAIHPATGWGEGSTLSKSKSRL